MARAKKSSDGNGTGANLGFEEKMKRLTARLSAQFTESAKLEKAIRENLKKVGYDL